MSGGPYLLIDAGNSRIKWALAQTNGTLLHGGALVHADLDDAPDWSALPPPRHAWVSNVAGARVAERIDALLDTHWPNLPRTTIRACAQQCGVTNGYAAPDSLGSDRWAGMIGAHAAFPGESLLIATFGTATTLEALRADGRFIGGLIAPGWSLMMRSLGEHTAQLPVLDAPAARELATHARPSFAADTRRSMSAGCALAQAGLVERMWADLREEWNVPVRLVVGGGAADEVVAALKAPFTRHDSLVLSGLALIAAHA
ncbi:type III pantothenate kinase [Paraburkholderia caballeronis]|uniref:type III pantothenate kinase n=1 Tax=Paraburkholderia caballeronis TaxID=416943 RepID=UPI0010648F23|nr:type III pantothenate kinase [Paraburkholderia caballeronis]TDV18506.1 type III pantothenate kinase [Paraburkholderia caballeronis]TDV19956.1 type III pantothenate kinase [Paraburkholderia caballeronis]TDV28173.1 type III pantothenate kinase [Paraburkholderia caballeronis]